MTTHTLTATSSNTSASDAHLVIYNYPRSCPRSALFQVRVNGQEVFVHHTNVADFAAIECSGPIEVEVEVLTAVKSARVRPLSRGIEAEVSSTRVRFQLHGPTNVSIEIDGLKPLFFYANPPEENAPAPDDPNVIYFKAGQVYEIGQMALESNQTLYIEGGAVVKGCLHTIGTQNVTVRGRGVFDGSYYQRGRDSRRSILFEHCTNVRVQDIIMIEPSVWMLVLHGCRDVHVSNLKEIGEVIGSDGIDIVSSSDVLVEGCFLRNNDDCVVIKAFDSRHSPASAIKNNDVENVQVRDCVFINDRGGNAIEIGYELRAEQVRGITFRNCDILSVHGHGAAFSIHNGDRAIVNDVLFEDIRVEHYYDKLVDFRVLHSQWNRDERRGQIRDITLRNIKAMPAIYNEGYTTSLIGGYDAEHTVEGVVFENFYLGDKKINNPDELDLYLKHATGVDFR
jgi:hypothetical protein